MPTNNMNDYIIEVSNTVSAEVETIELLQNTAIAALVDQAVPAPASVALLLTDDETLQALNLTFRNVDKPTDVLSFTDGEPAFPDAPIHLGDIAISMERAATQAAANGHSQQAELQLLVVHGILHLLGYDHGDSAEKAAMWQAQSTILAALECEITSPAA